MKNRLRVLLQILFPERDDAKIVSTLSPTSFAKSRPTKEKSFISLLPFSDTRVRACVHEIKFHKNSRAVSIIAAVLHAHLTQSPPQLIIPIPLSQQRQKERGYNQVTLVAQQAVQGTGHTLDTEILYRTVHTAPQTTLSKSERIKNMQNAFAVYEIQNVYNKIHGADIIILDDVTTTGATLTAAKAALLPHKPNSITCLAFAH